MSLKGTGTVAQKTGWLEKYNNGRVVSMVEVKYDRVKVKKTPRKKKGQPRPPSNQRDESLYYVLDKNTNYGELYLTGGSVFSKNEIVELELFVARHKARLRLLAKVKKTETFMELRRPLFRGDLHFAAINKQDFETLRALEDQRLREEAARPQFQKPSNNPPTKSSLKMTFKRT